MCGKRKYLKQEEGGRLLKNKLACVDLNDTRQIEDCFTVDLVQDRSNLFALLARQGQYSLFPAPDTADCGLH